MFNLINLYVQIVYFRSGFPRKGTKGEKKNVSTKINQIDTDKLIRYIEEEPLTKSTSLQGKILGVSSSYCISNLALIKHCINMFIKPRCVVISIIRSIVEIKCSMIIFLICNKAYRNISFIRLPIL